MQPQQTQIAQRRGQAHQMDKPQEADHFNREEKDELRMKWDAMDVEDAEEAMTSLQEELRAEASESQDGELSAV